LKATRGEDFVARLWWTFVLVAIVITGLVLGAWFFWHNKIRDKAITKTHAEDVEMQLLPS
jgi:hypothetical protein